MSHTRTLNVQSKSLNNIDEISALWTALEKKTDASYFQTWAWIGPWWRHAGKYSEPIVFTIKDNSNTIGAAIFSPHFARRRHVITSRSLHLNENGDRRYDFTIEYNGILTCEPDEINIAKAVLEKILSDNPEIDEIVFSGINKKRYEAYKQAGINNGLMPITTRVSKSSFVDLDKIRSEGVDYQAKLSRNTRSKIRRSIKAYQTELGQIHIKEAASLDQALHYLKNLKVFHQEHWEARDQPGSFSNTRWEAFIINMIEDQFDKGRIQLLRIQAGRTDIGFILNLVNNGHVNMLQSGFKYLSNNKMKPGYVSHFLAIEHNLANGNHTYDFLAGESQYKDSLATDCARLYWLTLQRKRVKFFLERVGVRFIRHLRNLNEAFLWPMKSQ